MEKSNAVVKIDLNAIEANLNRINSYLSAGVGQMAVVKENAYGHGAIEVAQHIEDIVSWFAVNDVSEGVELREAGITKPILAFAVPEQKFAEHYRNYNITATISALAHFNLLPPDTEYHLNFDTGMGRLGFRPEQAERVLAAMANHPELHCTGLYSHFATADETDSEKKSYQLQLFESIRQNFDGNKVTHMNNTAAAVQLPEAQYDMVRVGIGMYGYPPGDISIPGLKPAMRLSTHIVQVNEIKKAETVSYGARWQAPESGYLATMPIGYADGIPRGLSDRISVKIDGQEFPVVGTITMNYCMIFLGPNYTETGTEVQLWYPEQTAAHWAQKMSTIPYEMLTNISPKLRRRYS